MKKIFRISYQLLMIFGMLCLWLSFIFIAIFARFFAKRPFDVGLGPQPLINNVYHKKALEKYGHTARTFVMNTYFITSEFDFDFGKKPWPNAIKALVTFIHTVMNYKILYTYLNGTMLYFKTLPTFFRKIVLGTEPLLYKLAGMKLVVMPYGGDVQDLSLCSNLLMKNSIIKDYPTFQKHTRDIIQISTKAWSQHADHVISGCDWVWFMYHWDTLMSGHFSIDTDAVQTKRRTPKGENTTFKIFHAPNHMTIKGSKHFIAAVEDLQKEGYNVELVLVQKKTNAEVLELMDQCDLVADQLIIGWYAMTAIEAMSLSKPVLVYLHQDLLDLYEEQEVIEPNEIPLINCNFRNVKDKIREVLDNPSSIESIGRSSRDFVVKYHSLDYVGSIYDRINRSLI